MEQYTYVREIGSRRTLSLAKNGSNCTVRRLTYPGCDSHTAERDKQQFKSLGHPNIVQVVDCISQDSHTLCVVESYSEEGSLADRIGSHGLNARKCMQDAARGVQYLHSQKRLVHQRIRLSSLLVREGVVGIGDLFEFRNSLDECTGSHYDPPEAR